MIVSWNEDKNTVNKQKHGISFETAKLVFTDPYRIELYDVDHSLTEDRYKVIGMCRDVIVVVYTVRGNNHRIISARKATRSEREYYDKVCNG